MSVNLLDMLQSTIGKELVSQGTKFLGEPESNVKSGVATMLPNLLGAIMHQGSTADGASKLLGLINSPAVDSNLLTSGLSGLFSGGTATNNLMSTGTSLLSGLFGNKVGGLADAVAGVAGLKGSSATSLLSMAAPFVMGLLKQQTTSGNLNASGLMNLLGSQKSFLSGSLSDKIFNALGLGTVGSVLAGIGGVASSAGHVAADAVKGTANVVGNAATGAVNVAADAAKGTVKVAGKAVDATVDAGKAVGGGLMKWLPWIVAAIAAVFLLQFCMKKGPEVAKDAIGVVKDAGGAAVDATKAVGGAAVDATKAVGGAAVDAGKAVGGAAVDATKAAAGAVADVIPTGWGTMSTLIDGKPSLKVYFDSGKTAVSPEFAEKSKDIIEYVKKNAGAKVQVSGFNDTTGDKAKNEELSKNRAKAVREALEKAGIAKDAIVLQKPADTDGAGTNAEARRVEVTIAK